MRYNHYNELDFYPYIYFYGLTQVEFLVFINFVLVSKIVLTFRIENKILNIIH